MRLASTVEESDAQEAKGVGCTLTVDAAAPTLLATLLLLLLGHAGASRAPVHGAVQAVGAAAACGATLAGTDVVVVAAAAVEIAT